MLASMAHSRRPFELIGSCFVYITLDTTNACFTHVLVCSRWRLCISATQCERRLQSPHRIKLASLPNQPKRKSRASPQVQPRVPSHDLVQRTHQPARLCTHTRRIRAKQCWSARNSTTPPAKAFPPIREIPRLSFNHRPNQHRQNEYVKPLIYATFLLRNRAMCHIDWPLTNTMPEGCTLFY